jgi:hypothetical protein
MNRNSLSVFLGYLSRNGPSIAQVAAGGSFGRAQLTHEGRGMRCNPALKQSPIDADVELQVRRHRAVLPIRTSPLLHSAMCKLHGATAATLTSCALPLNMTETNFTLVRTTPCHSPTTTATQPTHDHSTRRLKLRAALPYGRTVALIHVSLLGVPTAHRRRDQQSGAFPPRADHLRG